MKPGDKKRAKRAISHSRKKTRERSRGAARSFDGERRVVSG
jgi:hypothetical protein